MTDKIEHTYTPPFRVELEDSFHAVIMVIRDVNDFHLLSHSRNCQLREVYDFICHHLNRSFELEKENAELKAKLAKADKLAEAVKNSVDFLEMLVQWLKQTPNVSPVPTLQQIEAMKQALTDFENGE